MIRTQRYLLSIDGDLERLHNRNPLFGYYCYLDRIQVPLAHMVHLHLIGARLHGAPQCTGGAAAPPGRGSVNMVQSPHIRATLDASQEHSSHPSNFVGA